MNALERRVARLENNQRPDDPIPVIEHWFVEPGTMRAETLDGRTGVCVPADEPNRWKILEDQDG